MYQERLPTVRAFQKPSENVLITGSTRLDFCVPVNDVICRLPYLFGDNRLMHILQNLPVSPPDVSPAFAFECRL